MAAQRGQIATREGELASARKAAAAQAARAAAELEAYEQHLDVVQGEADRQRASLRSKLDELTRAHSELERERSELSKLKRKCRQVNRRCDELERLSARPLVPVRSPAVGDPRAGALDAALATALAWSDAVSFSRPAWHDEAPPERAADAVPGDRPLRVGIIGLGYVGLPLVSRSPKSAPR